MGCKHAWLAPALETLRGLFILHGTVFYAKPHGSFPPYHYASEYELCWLYPTTLFVITPSLIPSSFHGHAFIPLSALFFSRNIHHHILAYLSCLLPLSRYYPAKCNL